MNYELSLKRLPNFLRYVNKVYQIFQTIGSMQGSRDAEVSPQSIFMSVFLCLASFPLTYEDFSAILFNDACSWHL